MKMICYQFHHYNFYVTHSSYSILFYLRIECASFSVTFNLAYLEQSRMIIMIVEVNEDD